MATKKQIKSVWLPRVDGVYKGLGSLKAEALSGESPEGLGSKLSEIYATFVGADSTLGVDAIISQKGGIKEQFVNAAQIYNMTMARELGKPELFRNTGEPIRAFEEVMQGFGFGLMSEDLVKKVSIETGIKPVELHVEQGIALGYSSAIIQALGNPELRKKYGLGK